MKCRVIFKEVIEKTSLNPNQDGKSYYCRIQPASFLKRWFNPDLYALVFSYSRKDAYLKARICFEDMLNPKQPTISIYEQRIGEAADINEVEFARLYQQQLSQDKQAKVIQEGGEVSNLLKLCQERIK